MLRTAIKFGVFVAICLAFTLWLAFTIGNVKLFQDRYKLTATFDDATGLLANDNVKISGVVVGKVTAVKADKGRAKVTFMVEKGYTLPSDSTAAIRWRNLIGQRYLYLYPGKASTALESGDEITKTESVIDLGELFNRLGPIVQALDSSKVNAFLDTVSEALQGNQDKVGQTISDLAVVLEGLGDRDVAIGRLVENVDTVAGVLAQRDQQIRTMLDNLVLLAQTFSDNTDTVEVALEEFGDFSASLATLLSGNRDEVDRLLANLSTVVTETVEPRLPGLDQAIADLDTASERIFRAGRLGEWLNQAILCADVDGPPCVTPIIKGLSSPGVSAGHRAPSSGAAIDAITRLVVGDPR